MSDKNQKPEKPEPKPSDYTERRDKADWIPCKRGIRKVLDTHPPPDKPPKK